MVPMVSGKSHPKYNLEYSPDTVDMETVSLSNNPKFIALIERSRARQKKEGGLSIQEMRRRLEKPKDLTRP
jgi:pyridoxine 5'-phosphate synthase PdxJ